MAFPPAWPDRISDALAQEWLQRASVQNGGYIPAAVDPDTCVAQTIKKMSSHIRDGVKDPKVRATAAAAIERYAGAARDPLSMAHACWWWAKDNIEFADDEPLMRRWLGQADHVELLIAPSVMVRMERPRGDCDDFTMAVASLLECCGISHKIVTVAADSQVPGEWSHVYPVACLTSGLLSLDSSHGEYPGWEASKGVTRRQVWDSSGDVDGSKARLWLVAAVLAAFFVGWRFL